MAALQTGPRSSAEIYRDYPAILLDTIEVRWAQAREQAAAEGVAMGLAPLEHSHWDWRNKAESVEAGLHMLVAVECEGDPQGIAWPVLPVTTATASGHTHGCEGNGSSM